MPNLTTGQTVFWDGWSTTEGFYVVEAEIVSIDDEYVEARPNRKYYPGGQCTDIPADVAQPAHLRSSYFDTPLHERLQENVEFVRSLTQPSEGA
ncbi:hypothetical protein F1728_06635 [Gimesia benthica]|uniref:Uncharacterized protein n=1 Tax=Gimesia benthica TaxID=2608982 RepID=A0A6I6ABJ0_9PLAN|nr:hypothetical protein [Gimesia benthica]QGQ22369.1 hypothetical protein F1728_06635 [Gimesia benthica]